MAISTPGDIVLDVVRAADPASVEAARARLASFAERASGQSFEVADAAGAEPASPHAQAGTLDAFGRFEAMVLQTFIQSMLPEDASSVYGQGMSGEMWQSMLAEQLGKSMAERGGIGISDRILRDYYMRGDEKVPLDGVSQAEPEAESRAMMSVALVQEIQRKVTQSLSEDRAQSATLSSR